MHTVIFICIFVYLHILFLNHSICYCEFELRYFEFFPSHSSSTSISGLVQVLAKKAKIVVMELSENSQVL